MKKAVFLLLFLAIAGFVFWQVENNRPVSLGAGVFAPDSPVQVALETPLSHEWGEYEITELDSFSLSAKVLSKKNYRFDEEAELSPVDLALGWGRMSDEAVLENLHIWQADRFFLWETRDLPIPQREIKRSSANMHLIPYDEAVKAKLKQVKEGQIIALSGSLVNVRHRELGWTWKTSRTRNDTRGGACEIVWLKELEIMLPERN